MTYRPPLDLLLSPQHGILFLMPSWTPQLLNSFAEGAAPPSLPWLVRGFLPAGALVQWAADPKTGKSFLALDLALATISGGRWLDLPIETPGPVVYFDEENSLAVIAERTFALSKGRGLVDLDKHLHLFRFRCLGQDIPTWATEARAITRSVRPVLVVFDTLLKFAGRPQAGKENDSSLMSAVCGAFRRVAGSATALFIHHLNKDPFGKSPRGSSVIVGDPDAVWQLRRPAGRAGRLSPVLLTPTESRFLDAAAPRLVLPSRDTAGAVTLGGRPVSPGEVKSFLRHAGSVS